MVITNNYNLPETIVEAVKVWTYKPKEHSIGVSALVSAPMQRYLQLKHWDEIEEDASDRLWALLGQSVHAVLDRVELIETLTEEKLVIPIEGYDLVLSGRIDLYKGETCAVEDYKVTSAYSFLLGNKPEWTNQLNVYAYLYRQHSFIVKNLAIHAILRDWMRSKAKQDHNYPQIPFHTAKIDLWSHEKQRQYIYDRIAEHMASPVRMCNDEERWYRGEKWAISKKGNIKAVRVLDTREEAEKYFNDKAYNISTHSIEKRPGAYAKCQDYCNVKAFCEFGKTLN